MSIDEKLLRQVDAEIAGLTKELTRLQAIRKLLGAPTPDKATPTKATPSRVMRRKKRICEACKLPFMASRKDARFHPRCYQTLYYKEKKDRTNNGAGKAKPAVLVPGDPLRPGH